MVRLLLHAVVVVGVDVAAFDIVEEGGLVAAGACTHLDFPSIYTYNIHISISQPISFPFQKQRCCTYVPT